MKKTSKVLVSFVILIVMISVASIVTYAASYPLIIPKEHNLTVVKGDIAQLEFTIFHEFQNEKYHINVYKGSILDVGKSLPVATAENTVISNSYKTDLTVTWNTAGDQCGEYTVEYYMSFYSLYEWHENPTRGKLMTIKVIDAPNPNVTVTIPTAPVTVNGKTIDNANAQYPYIVYNNITYCPMTYDGSRFLGLESNWSQASGLNITKLAGGSAGNGDNTTTSTQNIGSYPAVMASGKIEVNGKKIDNYTEEYPLLVFRDVTYFPLTWRFAVTEFGWDYSYTSENGLVINSK